MKSNYIYQTIHTLSHHPLHVAKHCRILEETFLELYLRPLLLDSEQITREIVELLHSRRVTTELSVFVELRIDINQEIEIVISEVSLYDGYDFRSIKPTAHSLIFDSPFGLFSTSARREALSFARDLAYNLGGEMVVECHRDGTVISGDGYAIFMIVGRTLTTSPIIDSVERGLVVEAAHSIGLRVEEHNILRNDLTLADELFTCDHRGITSISRYERTPYMTIIAEKIATALSQPW